MQHIVIVHEDATAAALWATRLAEEGFPVVSACGFEEGKALLDATIPALLIVSVRLGAYNGLHLIIRGRVDHPRMAAILTADMHDEALAAEAVKYGALFLAGDVSSEQVAQTAVEALSNDLV
jgi:DNA-binding NtrC family response regulator